MVHFDNLEFDLGDVKKGLTKSVKVNITNNSSVPVALMPANASCSCTSGNVDFSTMQPNSKAVFTISFNSGRTGNGKQSKSINLNYSFNRESFSQVFRIKANVI